MSVVVTRLSDIINPEVMGDMIEAKIEALNKISRNAKIDTTLQGVPGDTKTVPMWNYIGDAGDFDPDNENGDEIPLEKLTASTTQFTIKCAAKSIGITQNSVNSGMGDPVGQAVMQIAKSIAGKIDNDVIEAAYSSENKIISDTLIGYAPIVTAVCQFEDEEDGINKVMYIHPWQEATMLKDSDFLSADKFTEGVAVNGAIGKVAGCWVRKSKKVKSVKIEYEKNNDSGETTIDAENLEEYQAKTADKLSIGDKVKELDTPYNMYINPIIKLEPDSSETEYTEGELPALTIFLKKDIQIDVDWISRKQRWEITGAKYYGAALTNPAKVILLQVRAEPET